MGLSTEGFGCRSHYITNRSSLQWKATGGSRTLNPRFTNAVPVCDELAEVLQGWSKVSLGPWLEGSTGYRPCDRLRAAAKEVGIERIGFHALRRTWATTALTDWGLPEWMIQRVLRHTSCLTTGLYLSPSEQEIVARVKGISYRADAA